MKTIYVIVFLAAYCSCADLSDLRKAYADNRVVPDTLQLAPTNVLNVAYDSGVSAKLGNELTPTQVKDQPKVTWEAEKGAFYTLMIVDPDAPSRENHEYREIRHWLVMNIPESAFEKGDEVVEYIGAAPPKGTGLHRYIILVYKQPNGKIEHNEPRTSSKTLNNRLKTSASELAKKYNLGEPEFGNFFQAQYDPYTDVFNAQLVQ